MSFLTDLARLRETPKTPSEYVSYGLWLIDHAEAIEGLVRAAEEFKYAGRELAWNCQAMRDAGRKVTDALEKLNRSE